MVTNYPGSLDAYSRPSASTPMNASGYEGHTVVDNLYDAVEAIETELGTDPAGAQATVRARLEYVERYAAYVPGWWVSGTYTVNATSAGAAVTNAIGSANYCYWSPWWCPLAVTVDRIAVQVTTGASSKYARLGIYSTDATTGGPGALLLNAGEIDCSTTGVKELTVSQALTAGTLYWLAHLVESGSVYFQGIPTDSRPSIGLLADTASTHAYGAVRASRTYSSGFVDPAPAWGSMGGVVADMPALFWLRRT